MTQQIEIAGKKRPFNLSYSAYKLFQNEANKHKNIDHFELMAYFGFRAGHEKEGKKVDFQPQDMADWFDDDLEAYAKVTAAVTEAMPAFVQAQKKTLEMMQLIGANSSD